MKNGRPIGITSKLTMFKKWDSDQILALEKEIGMINKNHNEILIWKNHNHQVSHLNETMFQDRDRFYSLENDNDDE